MYKFDASFKLTTFAKGLPDEFLDKITTTAIAYTNSPQASKKVKMSFEFACQKEFKNNGSQISSATSRKNSAKNPLINAMKSSENMVRAVLNVWLEARHELCIICQDFLVKRGLPFFSIDELSGGFSYAIAGKEMENLVNELHALIKTVDKRELKLMLTLLLGAVPLDEGEFQDYPGVDLDSEAVPMPIVSAPTLSTIFSENYMTVKIPTGKLEAVIRDNALPVKKTNGNGEKNGTNLPMNNGKEVAVESNQPTAIGIETPHGKFKDTLTAINLLSMSLDKAKELVTSGNLEKLDEWASEFKQSTLSTLEIWKKDRESLMAHLQNMNADIKKLNIPGPDKEQYLAKVLEVYSRSKNNPYQLQKTRRSIDDVYWEAQKLAKSIKQDLNMLAQSKQSLDNEVNTAIKWGLDVTPWISNSVTLDDAEKLSRDEILRGTKINKDLTKQASDAVEKKKQELIIQLLKESADLSVSANDEQKQQLEKISEKISQSLSRDDFISVVDELACLREEVRSWVEIPDVAEVAKEYKNDPDPILLEMLLDSLAKNNRYGDVYLMLSVVLLAMEKIPTKIAFDKTVSDAYFTGFRDCTSAQELLINLVVLLRDTQLVYQTKIEDGRISLGLAVLYLSIMAVRPDYVNQNDLWQFYNEGIKDLSPLWGELIDQVIKNNLPIIKDSYTLPAEEIKQVITYLDTDFVKENGRYIRLRTRNSLATANMEQQYLLPLLDKKWEKLKSLKPGTNAWDQMKSWLADTDAESLYEDACNDAEILPNDSAFLRTNIEERIYKDLQYFDKYIKLKEEIDCQKPGNFVLLEDVLNSLDALQNTSKNLHETYVYLVQAILSNLENNADLQGVEGLKFSSIVEKNLLEAPEFWKSVPNAVAYVARHNLLDGVETDFVKAMISSFAEPLDGKELAEFYLSKNLPEIATRIHSSPDIELRADKLRKGNSEQLQSRLIELKKRKKSLTIQEDQWLASHRWELLFSEIDLRLELMRNEEKISSEQQRRKYADLINAVNLLDLPIMEASYIPPASKEELQAALDEIKLVCRKSYSHCIALAENLLAEIQHIMDYKDANLEGVIRVRSELNDAINNRKEYPEFDPTSLTMKKYIDALRSGNYDAVGVSPSIYSDTMIEDRIDLLKSWELIKGYPTGTLQSEAQAQDIHHFFRLFAKIVRVEYGEGAIGKPSHYFFRNPVAHFESALMKPGTDALRRNVVFLPLTNDVNPRSLRELDRIMIEENWFKYGSFITWFVLDHPEIAHDWVRRKYNGKPVIVIDENILLKILFSGNNPRSTGYFRHMLLRTVDPHSVSVFSYENFVDEEKQIFVGREEWIRSIANSELSFAVYGGRRIGKSSLLKAVERELKNNDVASIYIDLEGARSLKEAISAAQEILDNLGIDEPCETFMDFHRLLTKHIKNNPEKKIVILFDELDPYIRERRRNNEPHTLIDTCRNLSQEHRKNIRFVMAGFIELWKQLKGDGDFNGRQNPYMNFLYNRGELAALQSSEAQNIVKEGFQETLGFTITDPSIPRRIVDATTGHPAFVQKFCEQLFNRLHGLGLEVTEIQLKDIDYVKQDSSPQSFTSFVIDTLSHNLNKLSEIIVYLLATTEKEQFVVDDIYTLLTEYDVARISREKIKDSVQELLITGVFSTASAQTSYKFSVPGYADLLRQYDLTDREYLLNLIKKFNETE